MAEMLDFNCYGPRLLQEWDRVFINNLDSGPERQSRVYPQYIRS